MPILWRKYVKVLKIFTHQVDSLLERRQKEDNDMSVTNLGGYMTMTFLGYYDKVDIITEIEYLLFSTFPSVFHWSLPGGLEGGASAAWVGSCQVESQEEEGVGGPHGSGDPIDVLIVVIWEESYMTSSRYENWTVDISRRGLNQYENDNNILCSDLLGNQRGAGEP